jgi:hypothetical protein
MRLFKLIEELLKIKKEYQLQSCRHRSYDRLRECIQSSFVYAERRD